MPSRAGARDPVRSRLSRAQGRGVRRRVRAERDSLALVLGLIRSGNGVTRQEIERISGLGRAVVADRIATLIARGLVEEGDLGASTGGRAPRRIRFNATAGYILVGLLGSTTLGVGLADLSGRLLVEHHESGDITLGPAYAMDRLEALFDWMLDEHPDSRDVWGIALSVPGPVELTGGRLDAQPRLHLSPEWESYPVQQRLGARYGARVWVDNEVHLMALGELRAGRGIGADDLLFVKIGTGISATLCSDGRIHRGANGYAGDIGHVAVSDDSTVICRCGNTGCLEALAGGAAISREARQAALDGRSPSLAEVLASGRSITAADVGTAAHRGDPFSIELLSRCGGLVGSTLAAVVNANNPSLIVVGGGVAQAGEILIAAIREGLYRRSRSLATQDLRILRSEMGKTGGLVGAAIAIVDELFSWDHLRSWIDQGSPTRHRGLSEEAQEPLENAQTTKPAPPGATRKTTASAAAGDVA